MKSALLGVAVVVLLCPGLSKAGPPNDFNGDLRSDLLWRNTITGENLVWPNADASRAYYLYTVSDLDWLIAGTGDFDQSGSSDILWRHRSTGEMWIWYAAHGELSRRVVFSSSFGASLADEEVLAVTNARPDVGNAPRYSSVFWRNRRSGTVTNGAQQWLAQSRNVMFSAYAVGNYVPDLSWQVAGTGDVDGGGNLAILWRHRISGANSIWRHNYSSYVGTYLPTVSLDWQIVGMGDFNNDRRSDVLWHNPGTGGNVVWWSANPDAYQWLPSTALDWAPVVIADIDADRSYDIIWRNSRTGENYVWRDADATRGSYLPTVSNLAWTLIP